MQSAGPGPGTFPVEVGEISAEGFRLWLDDEALVVRFTEFPWFRTATAAELTRVERPAPDHLYWPTLDIDLAVESIRHPERFPLLSRS